MATACGRCAVAIGSGLNKSRSSLDAACRGNSGSCGRPVDGRQLLLHFTALGAFLLPTFPKIHRGRFAGRAGDDTLVQFRAAARGESLRAERVLRSWDRQRGLVRKTLLPREVTNQRRVACGYCRPVRAGSFELGIARETGPEYRGWTTNWGRDRSGKRCVCAECARGLRGGLLFENLGHILLCHVETISRRF